jgi:lysophospholipase L1-like esterase
LPRLGAFLAVLAALLWLGPAGASGTAAPVTLTLDYRIPPRYGLDRNRDGLVDSITTPAQVSPATWTALVTVRWPAGGPCAGTYRWTLGGRPVSFVQQRTTCTFAYGGFAALDRPYRVTVTATRAGTGGTGRTTVTIRDLLVVGLGDSTASGEGDPDYGITRVRWQDRRCHRSAQGFEAQAASRIEAASPKTSVTFVPLACSGASITTGMLGPYAGIAPSGGIQLPPQVDAMTTLIGSRQADAVLVSIGINDLGFGHVAFFCVDDGVDKKTATSVDCWNERYPTASSQTTLRDFVRTRAAALPNRFARLDAALDAVGIPAETVYVTEYPNGTRGAGGRTCDPLIPYVDGRPYGSPVRGMITRAEAAEAESELIVPVNDALRSAAATYGWHFVSGIAAQSVAQGLCAARPWFVGVLQSLVEQHDVLGTLHPNRLGQQAMAKLAVSALRF